MQQMDFLCKIWESIQSWPQQSDITMFAPAQLYSAVISYTNSKRDLNSKDINFSHKNINRTVFFLCNLFSCQEIHTGDRTEMKI